MNVGSQVWEAEVVPPPADGRSAAVCFTYTSIDGEEGYSGCLTASVTYIITARNELIVRRSPHTLVSKPFDLLLGLLLGLCAACIVPPDSFSTHILTLPPVACCVMQLEYSATTDKPSPINLTNHTYWNLTGNCQRTIHSHLLQLKASRLQASPIDSSHLLPIEPGTAYDFRSPTPIGSRIKETGGGYDHVYVLDAEADPQQAAIAAKLEPRLAAAAAATEEPILRAVADAEAPIRNGDDPVTGAKSRNQAEEQMPIFGSTRMRQDVATLADEHSGRMMRVSTNQPCLVVYTANFLPRIKVPRRKRQQLESTRQAKQQPPPPPPSQMRVQEPEAPPSSAPSAGTVNKPGPDAKSPPAVEGGDEPSATPPRLTAEQTHRRHGAVCLETLNFIGSLRFKSLPSMVLQPGQRYFHRTVHAFSIMPGSGSEEEDDQREEVYEEEEGELADEEMDFGQGGQENEAASQSKL